MIVGRATSSGISAASLDRHVYIGNVNGNVSEEDIGSFLAKNGIQVIGVNCLSKDNTFSRAFHVTVPFSDYNKISSTYLWENGITVRKFYVRRIETNDEVSAVI